MSEEAQTEVKSGLPEVELREIRTEALSLAVEHLNTGYGDEVAVVLRTAKSFAHFIETGESAIFEDVEEELEAEVSELPGEGGGGGLEATGRLVPRYSAGVDEAEPTPAEHGEPGPLPPVDPSAWTPAGTEAVAA
jgi:hypothetical protein